MTATVIVGANWGYEGKGWIVDYLAADAAANIRFQGVNNTGNTVINDTGSFTLKQLPSGISNPDCLAVLGPSMVVSPGALSLELARLAAVGIEPTLLISDRATLNLPWQALQVGWLLKPELLQRRINEWLQWKLPQLRVLYIPATGFYCCRGTCVVSC